MTSVGIFGVTGYAGRFVAEAAVAAGFDVTGYSRGPASDPVEGVTSLQGSIEDEAFADAATALNDVVIVAVSPREDMAGKVAPAVGRLAALASIHGTRLGVIGGAGSLLVEEGGPMLAATDGFPPEFADEAAEMAGVLTALRAGDDDLDWFYVSPAAEFGDHAPGEFTGTYRLGGDVLLTDENGTSAISGADLAHAVIAEVQDPKHRRERFTVAY